MQLSKATLLALSLVAASTLAFVPSASNGLHRVAPAVLPTSPMMMSSNSIRHKSMVAPSFMAAAVDEVAEQNIPEGTATVTELIFNLVKGIVSYIGLFLCDVIDCF